MQVILAKTAGFCYGVARAVRIAQDTAEKGGGAMLGSIVHNAHVIEELERSGMRQISSAQEAGRGERVLIRAHGESKETLDALTMRGADIVYATCPNVCRIQSLVTQAEQEGRKVVIIGEAHHPEVIGIAGWCTAPLIFEDAEKVRGYFETHPDRAGLPMILVSQTTCVRTVWESCVNFLKKECTNLKIHDTICSATQKRQSEAADIAARVDAMVIVGDRKSANTRHLTEICRERCSKVLQIETADELSPEFFSGCRTAGLTAGASTPASIIMEVLTTMTEEIKTMEGNESFEEMLEKSFKTLNTGDKVTCVVTAIGATEVQVDVKVGDEIEAYVVRVNDVEGYATLSKKRLDAVKLWEDIESAVENKTVLEGIVTEENKGGIVVSVKGVRVFVPASQSGLPKDSDLSQLLKQKVQLRITEVNRARRRVVGSIKSVTNEARQAAQAAVWAEIEVGKHYDGVVKSMTSYGVFVDIGGVDGMVHISELSWSRIKHPSEIVAIGDHLDVYVISFDAEKRKISLGVKDKTQNPWDVFMATYHVGDVANVRIVKLMTFGAFAEVVPGVDGLIHISQIADRRIDKPSDVLSEGQMVDAKITAIDEEKKKISLSIRALLAPAAEEAAEETAEEAPAAAEEAAPTEE